MSALRNEIGQLTGAIRCDMPDCTTLAPDDAEIVQGRGLVNMGWYCKGGRHMCPDHNPDR